MIFIEEIFIVVQRQSAVIFGQAELLAVRGKERLVLRRIPIVNDRLIELRLNIRPQVE